MKTHLIDPDDIRDFSSWWYTMGRRFLPAFETKKFASFAGYSNAFAIHLNPTTPIELCLDPNVPTAFVNTETGRIHIGARFFTTEPYVSQWGPRAKDATEELAIACINGMIIHEALHIKYTLGDVRYSSIKDLLTLHGTGPYMIRTYGLQVCATVFNVVEDIYIENRLDGSYREWMDACNATLFDHENLAALPETIETHEDLVRTAIFYKVPWFRDEPELLRRLTPEMLSILENILKLNGRVPLTARIELAFKLIELLKPPEQSEEDVGTIVIVGDSCKAGSGANDFDAAGKVLGGLQVGEALAKALEEAEEAGHEAASNFSDAFSDAAQKAINEAAEWTTLNMPGGPVEFRKPHIVEISHFAQHPKGIVPNKMQNWGFLRDLVGIASDNRSPGPARKTGSIMVPTRLPRIATDEKLFARSDSMNKRQRRKEIIILVDLSGSTWGDLAAAIVGNAHGICQACRQARISHALYAHTTEEKNDMTASTTRTYSYSQKPLIAHVYSYDMLADNTEQEVKNALDNLTRIDQNENVDGVALEYVSRRFTGRDAARYILVVSDGRPNAPGYRGQLAMDHVKSVVGAVRRRGIAVIALSVDSSVVKENNYIYGEEFNVDASQDLEGQFRRLFTKIALSTRKA